MSEQTTVTYSLETILQEIISNQKETNAKLEANQKETNAKLEANQKETNTKLEALAVGQARLEEKINGVDKRLEKVEKSQEDLVKDVADLKGAKALVVPVVVAVVTAIATLLIKAIPIQ